MTTKEVCIGVLSKSATMSTTHESLLPVVSVWWSPSSSIRAVWIVVGSFSVQSLQYIRLQHEKTPIDYQYCIKSVIRPPETVVPEGLCFTRDVFYLVFISS